MAREPGQKGDEVSRDLNEVLGEVRGLVYERPLAMARLARLAHAFAPSNQVLIDTINDHLPDNFSREVFALQLELTPRLIAGDPLPIPDLWSSIWKTLDLSGANLTGANLAGANLAGAKLTGAKLVRAKLLATNLTGAKLARANLTGATLFRANLAGANLRRADLVGADLSRANLSDAELSRANLARAHLNDVTLTGVRYDEYTVWPRHFDVSRLD